MTELYICNDYTTELDYIALLPAHVYTHKQVLVYFWKDQYLYS